jgi:HAD superfamily phosphoserine phosphatase-like hydrolase
METHGIAVFDVCGTITKTNNTFHFIAFVLKRERTLRYGLLVLIRILSPLFRLPGIRSMLRRDLLREGQIALLRGYSRARLREMAELYVNDLFTKDLLNHRVLDAMRQEKDRGQALWLVSAAIDPPIAEIARRLKIQDYFCSELEMRDGHCTGRLRTDLLGRKRSILGQMSGEIDWEASAVYSDNLEDAPFMARFGRRTVILNAPTEREAWKDWPARYLVSYDEHPRDEDIDSVNVRTVRWVYLPLLYYIISRFHRRGVFALLLREVVPVTLASYWFTPVGAFSFVLMPLSFLMFYSIYEIGGLVNDLAANRESPQRSGTRRIAPQVRLNPGLFVALRLALVGPVLAWLSLRGYPVALYLGALLGCLAIFLLHTLILSHLRLLTFLLLKICRNSIPLLLLASHVPSITLVYLCAIFSALDAPWRLYVYYHSRGLGKKGRSIRHVRYANVAILCGLGAIVYLVSGSPHLLGIASYYAVLDGLRIIRL